MSVYVESLSIVQILIQQSVYEVTVLKSRGTNGKSKVVLADYELVVSVTCRRQKNVQQEP